MPNVLAIGDLERVLTRAGGWIAGAVAASPAPTTATFAVTGYDLSAAPSLAGALCVVGELGQRQVATIASNSGSTLTLQTALGTTPAVGAPVVIYPANVTVTANENVGEVGGVGVPTPGTAYSGPVIPIGGNDGTDARYILTDTSGRPQVTVATPLPAGTNAIGTVGQADAPWSITVDDAQGTPATTAPTQAVQIGGTDGTDLRALATDTSGRPQVTVATPLPAGTNAIGTVGQADAPWSITVDDAQGTPASTAPTQAVQVGGTDGTDLRALATDTSGRITPNIVAVGGASLPTGATGNPALPIFLAGAVIQLPTNLQSSRQGTLDSTTTALAASGTYTTASAVSCAVYRRIVGSVYSDQNGTLNVQQSPDGTNWDVTSTFTVTGGTGQGFSVEVVAPYMRLDYVNGTTAQTTFRLYAWGTPNS
jgi:5-hydroxyisourate hydrolase-like protein (transthyretin family)